MPSKFRRSASGLLLGVTLMLAGCAQDDGAVGAPEVNNENSNGGVDWSAVEPVELTVSSQFTPGVSVHDSLTEWADSVTEASEGKITFDFYDAGVISGPGEEITAMSSGLADIVYMVNSTHPDQLPVSNWVDRVILDATWELGYPDANVTGAAQFAELYSTVEPLRDEMEKNGFLPLMTVFTGPSVLTCTEPFQTPADLVGRQVRTAGEIPQAQFESLGMTGTYIPPVEVYEAHQRGMLDCSVNAATFVEDVLEVAPYVSIPSTAVAPSSWVISTDAWAKFSPEVQQVLMELLNVPLANYSKDALDIYAQIPDGVETVNGEFVEPDPLNEPITQWWSDQPSLEETAPSSVESPAAVVNQIQETVAWWKEETVEGILHPGARAPENLVDTLRQGGDVADWDKWAETLQARLAETMD